MTISPGYGETPIDGDELDALLPSARELLDEPITKAAVYDLEQAIQDQVAEELVTAILASELDLDELLTDHFVRDLHRRLYGDIWTWAGVFRQRELNIGVAPEQIATELRSSLETIHYRWKHTDDWTAHQLGIAAHAEVVRIHPFADGNGRTTRLLADLAFAASQSASPLRLYDWSLNKRDYIVLLRQYDQTRDSTELAAYVASRAI